MVKSKNKSGGSSYTTGQAVFAYTKRKTHVMQNKHICSEVTYTFSKTNSGVQILSTGNITASASEIVVFHCSSRSLHTYREKINGNTLFQSSTSDILIIKLTLQL